MYNIIKKIADFADLVKFPEYYQIHVINILHGRFPLYEGIEISIKELDDSPLIWATSGVHRVTESGISPQGHTTSRQQYSQLIMPS